jgi:hypothetical protein
MSKPHNLDKKVLRTKRRFVTTSSDVLAEETKVGLEAIEHSFKLG